MLKHLCILSIKILGGRGKLYCQDPRKMDSMAEMKSSHPNCDCCIANEKGQGVSGGRGNINKLLLRLPGLRALKPVLKATPHMPHDCPSVMRQANHEALKATAVWDLRV